MPEEETRRKAKAEAVKRRKLLRSLLMLALVLSLVIVIQIGVVYYEGTRAGQSAEQLLSAFQEKQKASPSPSPEVTIPEEDSQPEAVSQADIASSAGADEHQYMDGSENQTPDGDYVQPEGPEIAERDRIIREITEKVGEDGIIGVLSIPDLKEELPIIGKWSYDLLKISICRYQGPGANEPGNLVVLGHNYKNGSHFGRLDELKTGSLLYLTDLNNQKVCYEIYDIETIAPTAFAELEEYQGEAGLTLVTCKNSGNDRQVFRCRQMAAG